VLCQRDLTNFQLKTNLAQFLCSTKKKKFVAVRVLELGQTRTSVVITILFSFLSRMFEEACDEHENCFQRENKYRNCTQTHGIETYLSIVCTRYLEITLKSRYLPWQSTVLMYLLRTGKVWLNSIELTAIIDYRICRGSDSHPLFVVAIRF